MSEQGWKIVLLLRLSPVVPFNVQNYLFGITRIGFAQYALATAIGILPGASLFISIGAFGHGRIIEMVLGSTTEYVLRNADCPVFLHR